MAPPPASERQGVQVARLFQLLASFGAARLIAMAAVAAGLIGFFLFVTMRLTEPQMSLLYGDLDVADSGRIVEHLKALNVPYKIADNGRTILAPADRVNELRVTLASEGLGGNIVGYEIFDRSEGLGTTSFVQNINRLRAIEGELARTIREIRSVEAARVHVVMPERALFARGERKPSASIILRTKGGLSQSQVAAIQYLVASAVPDLSPQNISIVDQNGTLLARSGGNSSDSAATMISSLDEKRRQLEDYYRTRIEELLAKTVGPGHVRAQVAVELDMKSVTTNEETFDPDSQVARSTRTVEETSTDRGGAAAGAVSVANNLPGAADNGSGGGEISQTQKTEETTNFEISRKTRTEVKERGEIERLTVAVVVDGTYSEADDGTRTYQPRSDDELEQMAALVRSAVGYDANRGDVVEVANMRFSEPDLPDIAESEPFTLFGLNKSDLYALAEMALLGIVSIFVLLLVVRPLVNRLIAAIPEAVPAGAGQLAGPGAQGALAAPEVEIPPELEEAAARGDPEAIEALNQARAAAVPAQRRDSNIDLGQVDSELKESSVKKIGEIVASHPDEATAIIRSWLYAE
ncbi:MAG: flagellar M-ring protein FliF [Alphaproteobacteria bacterium]|nr:MAG: flagellar M-ring protein FliF [Alphaproteobacteria bacterium]